MGRRRRRQPGAGGRDVGREGRELGPIGLDHLEIDPARARGCYDGERPASALAHARADSSVGRARPYQAEVPGSIPWSANRKFSGEKFWPGKLNRTNPLEIS